MTTSHSSETFVLFYPLLFLYQTQLHLAYRRLQGFKRIPFFQKIPHSVKNFIPKNYYFTVKMCTFILFYKNPPSFFSENPPSFLYPKLLYSKFFIHRDIYNYSIYIYIFFFFSCLIISSSSFFFSFLSFFFFFFLCLSLNSVRFFETKIHLNIIPWSATIIVALWAC